MTYYGISLTRFSGELTDAGKARFAAERGGPVVGYVARMEEEMGLAVLLDALPALLDIDEDLSVVIAGRQGVLTARAVDAAATSQGRVVVITDPENDVVADVYALSTVVVVPSTNERACLGLAIAEASASGCPVVVSDVGGGPEILGAGAGTLVPPNDPAALVTAVRAFIVNPADAQEAGARGRDFIAAHFDQATCNAEIETLFSRQVRAAS